MDAKGPGGDAEAESSEEFLRFADIPMIRELLPEDAEPFALVLRGHLLLEHALIELLKHALPRSQELKSRLSYQHRIELNVATGLLPSDFAPFLEYVSELRNRYAHNLRFELTVDDEAVLLGRVPAMVRHFAFEEESKEFPGGLRESLIATYIAIAMTHWRLIDDAGRLGVVGKRSIRAMLEAAFQARMARPSDG